MVTFSINFTEGGGRENRDFAGGGKTMISRNARRGARDEVLVRKNELRQLLFWASIGVGRSSSGAYWECVEATVREVGRLVGFKPAASWGFKKK